MVSQNSTRKARAAFALLSLAALLPSLANAVALGHTQASIVVVGMAVTVYCILLALLRPRVVLLIYGAFVVTLFPLDLISLLGTHEPISYGLLNSIANTTPAEAAPQLKPYTLHIVAMLAAFAGYFYLLFRCVPWRYRLPKPLLYFSPFIALCTTLIVISFLATLQMRSGTFPQKMAGSSASFTKRNVAQRLIDNAFLYISPIRELKLLAKHRKDRKRIEESLYDRPVFADSLFSLLPGFDTATIGILSIGETSRACNWQLAGYPRPTTPRLAKRTNLFFFADAYSGGTFTDVAAPMLYANDSPRKLNTWETSPILNEIFHANGITTALASMQGSDLKWSIDKYMLVTRTCDTSWVYLPFTYEPAPPDITLIPHVTAMLHKKKRPLFLTFWGYGGHAVYQDCYEAQDAHFQPDNAISKEGNINAFDNTIIHTDRVHDSLISLLEATGKPAFLIYAADHGELLYDLGNQLLTHNTQHFAHGEAHVPCFVWLSDAYIAKHPHVAKALAGNLQKPVQTPSIFHTAQHLMRAVGPDFDSTLSLASTAFRPPASREGVNSNYELRPAPPFPPAERLRADSAIAKHIETHKQQ